MDGMYSTYVQKFYVFEKTITHIYYSKVETVKEQMVEPQRNAMPKKNNFLDSDSLTLFNYALHKYLQVHRRDCLNRKYLKLEN